MKETPQTKRLILAILAVIVGLFMITVAPVLIQTPMERVVAGLMEVSKTKPQYASGIMLFSFTYPLYRGPIFIGGVMLILFAARFTKAKNSHILHPCSFRRFHQAKKISTLASRDSTSGFR